jgi:radical SAM protein with 4Fe4S-binding SPASM domain
MCPRTVALEKKEFSSIERMTLEDFRDAIDQGTGNGLCSIKLNYLGEPLIHPDVVEQVRYAKQKGLVDVMFNTNGTLLTPEKSENLLESGLDKLFFSFDSPYAEEYEKIRVGARFDEVLENIKFFYKLKSERYPHVQVRVSMVVMAQDPKIREDFISLFRDIVDAVGFDEYRNTEDISDKPVVEGFACAQLYQRMFLRTNGEVIVCCADEKGEYIVGNWKAQPLKEIWHGEKYAAIRNAHKQGRYHAVPMCRRCTVPMAQEKAFEREVQG